MQRGIVLQPDQQKPFQTVVWTSLRVKQLNTVAIKKTGTEDCFSESCLFSSVYFYVCSEQRLPDAMKIYLKLSIKVIDDFYSFVEPHPSILELRTLYKTRSLAYLTYI